MKEVTRAIIINEKREVLVGLRARGAGKGLWALVGGKIDPSETAEECVIREVKEELGLMFCPVLWKEEIDDSSDPGNVWKVYYFIGPTEGAIQKKEDEISETMYVSITDVAVLAFAFGHEKILKEYFVKNITT